VKENLCQYETVWPNGRPRHIFLCPENKVLSECSYFKCHQVNSDCCFHRREYPYDEDHYCASFEAQNDSAMTARAYRKLEEL